WTRSAPAAFRLTTIVLSRASPITVSTPAPGVKTAETAGVARPSSDSRPKDGANWRRLRDRRSRSRRPLSSPGNLSRSMLIPHEDDKTKSQTLTLSGAAAGVSQPPPRPDGTAALDGLVRP